MIKQFLKRMFAIPLTEEENLCKLFKRAPQLYYKPLAAYFQSGHCPQFKGSGRYYKSASGCVTVCRDIYGPEVKVNGGNELLDCDPDAYGLLRDQALLLYNAILSNVPGTVNSVEKLEAKLKESA